MRYILILSAILLCITACTSSEGHKKDHAKNTVKLPSVKDASATLKEGQKVFAKVCKHCHLESDYAPELSDKKEWNRRFERIKKSKDVFYTRAIDGFGDMSPKGGPRGKELTKDQVRAAVDYILAVTVHH